MQTKFKFSQLNKKKQIELCTLPQSVFVTVNPDDETEEDIENRQEKFLALPTDIKEKLVSYETAKIIQKIGKKYNLELLQLASLARAIRSYYFKELKLDDFPRIFIREAKIDRETAQNISQELINKIINNNNVSNKIKENIILLPIQQALNQYERLGEQTITSERIKIKPLSESARPSIKNWIYDYHYHLGTGSHTVMERGNYLFHSENTKKLTNMERKKLALILKSLDEQDPLKIDKEKEEVIFPVENNIDLVDLYPKPKKKMRHIKQKIENNFPNNFSSNKISKNISKNKQRKASFQKKKVKLAKETISHPEHWLVGQDHKTMFQSVFNELKNKEKDQAQLKTEMKNKVDKTKQYKENKQSDQKTMKKDSKSIDNTKKNKDEFNQLKKDTKNNYLKSRLFRIRPSGAQREILKSAQNVINLKEK